MLRTIISYIFKFITSKALLVALLALIFCLSIYYFGEKLNVGSFHPFKNEDVRSYTILGIILVAGLLELYYFSRFLKKYRDEKVVKDKNQEETNEVVVPDYIEKQENQFKQLCKLINNSFKNKGVMSGGAMYATPWYLVLGKEESGKTAFIENSSLPFLMDDRLLDINNDKNDGNSKKEMFRWKISNNAVIVEAKGDLFCANRVDGDEHKEEIWNHFLGWLRKVRSNRPLNGLVITINVEDLVHASTFERDEYAENLKNKVRYFNESLGVRLPVYLVVSKLDLLEGFTEFFKDVRSDVRDQILGFSFPLETKSSSYWKKDFKEQYEEFIALLNHHLVRRVGTEDSRNASQKVYSFVRQLVGLQEILFDFMVQVFEEDRYSTFPLVRGLYFTSIYQQSVPLNAISESATQRYSLPEVICDSRKGQSKPHFSKHLFQQIILPELGISGDSFYFRQERKAKHRKAFFISGLALSLMTAGWFYYFQLNRESVREIYQGLVTYDRLKQGISQLSKPEGYLESLNTLRAAVDRYQSYGFRIPVVSHMGLYRGQEIAPKVNIAYDKLLSDGFLPSLARGLLENLDVQGGTREELKKSKYIENLRIVRLLVESPKGKTAKELESLLKYKQDLVMPWFEASWQKEFESNGQKQESLQSHLNYAFTHVGANIVLSEQARLKSVQSEIGRISLAERLFLHIESEAERVLTSSLDFRNIAGKRFDEVFGEFSGGRSLDILINPLFTNDGFHHFYTDAYNQLLSTASIDAWALGKRATTDSFSKADIRKLKTQVNDIYRKKYVTEWSTAINKLVVPRFDGSMLKALKLLGALNDADNPYRSILASLQYNTTLYSDEEFVAITKDKVKEKGKNKEAINKGKGFLDTSLTDADKTSLKLDVGIPLAKSFSSWNGLMSDKTGKTKAKAYLEDIEFAFVNLYDYMKDIQQQSEGSNGAPYALQKVIDRLTLKAEDDPIYSLERIANGMKEPFRSNFKKIAKESWRVVLGLAASDLDRLWKEDVYDFYQENIAGRYPLVKTQKEVSFRHFQEFFSKEGKLQVFYDKYLKLLLEDNRSQVYNPEENIALISPNVLKTLKHAKYIREGFFSSKGGYKVEFSIEPIDLSGVYFSSVLNIDGVPIPYNHGKSILKDMVWPNQIESSHRSSISLNPISRSLNQEVIIKEGAWSWFRLLDTAITNALSSRAREFRFNFRGGHASYRLKVLDTINPFTRDLFSGFNMPQTLKPRNRDVSNNHYDSSNENDRI